MNLTDLTAISPIDGRYRKKVLSLAPYFSEFALIRYRLKVEVLYFLALCKLPVPQLKAVPQEATNGLHDIYEKFTEQGALRIKEIEKTTNHDVKAVEYYIKEQFEALGLGEFKEFIHFGLTSQDINNTAIPLMTKDALAAVFIPEMKNIITGLDSLAAQWEEIPMLARTHGQPASPTRLGKEIRIFSVRLQEQLKNMLDIPFAAKFGGATGNFNAHHVAYPDIDWHHFADTFVKNDLGLKRSFPTSQIEHYDHFSALFDAQKRLNTILIDFSRDIWHYISINYFKQKVKAGEVGSSAMPHKVNPIDFENAEGNLGIANALFEHLSAKLPISRLQRDLTDSTVLRNIGVPFAHTLLAFNSLTVGINKMEVNESAIRADLEDNWAVVAEAIQTILRREGFANPYEALKDLTRTGGKIDKNVIHTFIESLNISDGLKKELKAITPFNYLGK